ncbi:tripartite motif-containing protein 16-like [Anguilla rostrata]|uniref:tripartite motif-containing protein 16-like n=1 Tax=Anguilla rostrata TaxID=7938 RepID=UPI0030D3D58B
MFQAADDVGNPQPRREDFLQYFCPLTLDLNTAHRRLQLSEGGRKITYVNEIQPDLNHDNPERFDHKVQVLCSERLLERHYWEVKWKGDRVCVAVSYEDIGKKGEGDDCRLGSNNKSWSLRLSNPKHSVWHSGNDIKICALNYSIIGVYLDHGAGTLSFYSVSDTMTPLYTVKTEFTKPLCPAFGFSSYRSSVKLCDLNDAASEGKISCN